jgi:hypothetical protein
MLTGYQIETVAYLHETYGGIICPACARETAAEALTSDGELDRLRLGIAQDGDAPLTAISRYELDEHRAALAADHAYEGVDGVDEDDPDTWPPIECEKCYREVDA